MTIDLRCFIYTSRLAPDNTPAAVGAIVKQAREHNAIHGITGVLIFNGEWFAQYIEGEPLSIEQLVRNLVVDSRHCELKVHMQDPLEQRRFAAWCMGYADVENAGFDMEALRQTEGQMTLDCFLSAAKVLDIA